MSSVFLKIEDDGTASLLIFFSGAMWANAFLRLQLPQFAGWLRLIPQAEQ
jgi:hypothetical protein